MPQSGRREEYINHVMLHRADFEALLRAFAFVSGRMTIAAREPQAYTGSRYRVV